MPKPIKVDDNGIVEEQPKGDREKRWQAYVADYAIKNPVKFAAKNERGEFDKVPASFK